MSVKYIKGESKNLRELGLDEKWLQSRIKEDPSILGLGDLSIIERERLQPTGGRLDFLMSDPEEGTRYEIEIMLGILDESHIIRTIEYWDVERTRFPQLEHRAVIVAEEITSRFFNVISILNRAVPIIAIQLDPILIEDKLILHFTKVLDISELYGGEEDTGGERVNRDYWVKRSNPNSLGVVDKMVSLLPSGGSLTYNKYHIALGTSGRNFAWFHPRKAAYLQMYLLMNEDEKPSWQQKLDEAGIYSKAIRKEMSIRLTSKELSENEALIRELLNRCEEISRVK